MGDAEIALSEDCFYSQVIGVGCCGDHGLLRIPVLSVKDIRQQSCTNVFFLILNKYSYENVFFQRFQWSLSC